MDELKNLVSKLREAQHKLEQLKFWIRYPEINKLTKAENIRWINDQDLINLLGRIADEYADTTVEKYLKMGRPSAMFQSSRCPIDVYLNTQVFSRTRMFHFIGYKIWEKTRWDTPFAKSISNPERTILELNKAIALFQQKINKGLSELISELTEIVSKTELVQFWIAHPEVNTLTLNSSGFTIPQKHYLEEQQLWSLRYRTQHTSISIDEHINMVIKIDEVIDMAKWGAYLEEGRAFESVTNPERVLLELNTIASKTFHTLNPIYTECFKWTS